MPSHILQILALVLGFACSASQAQVFRAYLASDGSDTNNCSLLTPCRLLPAALAAVMNGGEIWMLDSANYNTGPVTINKSVSILAIPGAVGSVLARNGSAIVVDAHVLDISLRNLVIVPFPDGSGVHGVHMTGNSQITIESSLIAGIPQYGVLLDAGTVRVLNSTLRNIGGSAVRVNDTAAAYVTGSRIVNCTTGVEASSSLGTIVSVRVSDTFIASCIAKAIVAVAFGSTSVVNAVVTRTVIQSTMRGIEAQGFTGGIVTLSLEGSSITANAEAGFYQSGGAVIRSHKNNHFDLNGPNTGALTPVDLQ